MTMRCTLCNVSEITRRTQRILVPSEERPDVYLRTPIITNKQFGTNPKQHLHVSTESTRAGQLSLKAHDGSIHNLE